MNCKPIIIVFISFSALLHILSLSVDAADIQGTSLSNPFKITIDIEKIISPLPETYKPGIWIAGINKDPFMIEKFFDDNIVGVVQLTAPLPRLLRESKDFDDYKNRLLQAFIHDRLTYNILNRIKQSGAYLFIGHFGHPMPAWLASERVDKRYTDSWWYATSVMPPKCYDFHCIDAHGKRVTGWAGIIEYTLSFFYNRIGIKKLGYFLGHEQNKDWIGSEEDFYKLYKYTHLAANKVSPSILTGGVGPMSWDSKRMPCHRHHYNDTGLKLCKRTDLWSINGKECKDPLISKAFTGCKPVLQNFLEYGERENLPVDFLNWHMFALPPYENEFNTIINAVNSWTGNNQAKNKKSFKLYPGDWAYWSSSFASSRQDNRNRWYPFDPTDTEENASYVVAMIHEMAQAGIQWHSHDFNIKDFDKEKVVYNERRGEFIGDWPIFTDSGIIKPVYNAFRAVSIFAGKNESELSNRLLTEYEKDRFIKAAASRTSDGSVTRVLVTNFIPTGFMANRNKLNILCKRLNDSEIEDLNCLELGRTIAKVLKKRGKRSSEDISRGIESKVFKYLGVREEEIKAREKMTASIREAEELISVDMRALNLTRQIEVVFKTRDKGDYVLREYLIDGSHSNSCHVNKRTESKPSDTPCGINGELDIFAKRAKQEASGSAITKTKSYMIETGFSENEAEEIIERYKVCMRKNKGPAQCFKGYLEGERGDALIEVNRMHKYYFKKELFKKMETINNRKNVALEMVSEKVLSFKGDTLSVALEIKPFSTVLIELSKSETPNLQ